MQDEETKHFFQGRRNYIKIIEKEEKLINNCLYEDDNYLLTNKNYKQKHYSKSDVEKILDKLWLSK